MDFEEFAEIMERLCFGSWRSAIGKDRDDVISEVSSVLFTKDDLGDEWKFTFALRRDGRWVQSSAVVGRVEWDPYDPPSIDDYDPDRRSPQNIASTHALEMLEDIAGRI